MPIEMPPYLATRKFDLTYVQQLSPTGESGFIQTLDRTSPFWLAEYSTGPLVEDRYREWIKFLDALEGSRNTFLGYDPRRPMPYAYRTQLTTFDPWAQSGLIAPTITAFDYANSTLTIGGLANGVTIYYGDYVSANVGGIWYLFRSQSYIPSVTGNSAVISVKPRPNIIGLPSGTNLVTNGAFTTDTTGWAASNGATLSAVSGRLRVTSGGSIFGPGATQLVNLTVGRTYRFTATAYPGTSTATDIRVHPPNSTNFYGRATGPVYTADFTFSPTVTQTYIDLMINATPAAGVYVEFDDVSITEVAAVRYRMAACEMKIIGKIQEDDQGPSGFPEISFRAGQYIARVPA